MAQFLLNINDESKTNFVLEFLKSVNLVSVERIGDQEISLTKEQKQILNHRRSTSEPGDFIDWKIAKKQLRFKQG